MYIDNYVYKYMQLQCTEYIYVCACACRRVGTCVCTYIKYSVPRFKKKGKKGKAPAPSIVAGLAHCRIGGKIQRSPGRG